MADSKKDEVAADHVELAEFRAGFTESIYNGNPIDWNHWIHSRATLVTAEAARLMAGLDPSVFTSYDSRPNKNDPSTLVDTAKRFEALAVASGMSVATPMQWMDWADNNGLKLHSGFKLETYKRLKREQNEANAAMRADRHGRELFTPEEIAESLGTQQNWSAEVRRGFLRKVGKAVAEGALRVRDPLDEMYYTPSNYRAFYDLVSASDFNAWLKESGASYSWDVPSAASDVEVGGSSAPPKGLSATQIQQVFGSATKRKLAKTLSNGKSSWVIESRTREGRAGDNRNPALFNPFQVACHLKDNGTSSKTLTKLFSENELLAEWKEDWANYIEHGDLPAR